LVITTLPMQAVHIARFARIMAAYYLLETPRFF